MGLVEMPYHKDLQSLDIIYGVDASLFLI